MSSRSRPVKGVVDAMAIAKAAAEKAGLVGAWIMVTDAKMEEQNWVVTMAYYNRTFVAVIDSQTGDVIAWREKTANY